MITKSKMRLPWACAAGLALGLLAQPAVANNGTCFFQTNGGTLLLAFGTLNPSAANTVVANMTVGSVNADQVGSCRTGTMTVTASNGLNFSGGVRRLRSGATANYIPYTLSSLPWTRTRPGNNTYVALPAITGTILGTDYVDAAAGSYADTVTLNVTP